MKNRVSSFIGIGIFIIAAIFIQKNSFFTFAQLATEDLLKEEVQLTPTITSTSPIATIEAQLKDPESTQSGEVDYEVEENGFVQGVQSELNTLKIDDVKIDEKAAHSCTFDSFTKKVKRNTEDNFTFLLTSPDALSIVKNALTLGDLPDGVTASISNAASKKGDAYEVNMNINEFAQRGSFNIMVFYEKTDNDEESSISVCQFNVIIE